MKKIKNTLVLILVFLLLSCEGTKFIASTVISSDSGKPIQNAEINVLNRIGDSTITDSNGKFRINSGFIGMTFGGPKFKFEIKKKGFETVIVKTKWGKDKDTIRLKPLK